MRCSTTRFRQLCLGTALAGLPFTGAFAAVPQIAAAIDDSVKVTLTGDISARVNQARDLGELDGATALPHIRLELKRPAEQQAALDKLVRAQWTKGSPRYHQWLSPADLRAYGPAESDIAQISTWLQAHGLTVNSVSRDGMSIDFGGSAAKVAAAFNTSLHTLSLNGETHIANVQAPAIPAAMAPAVTGVTLHNFFPRPMARPIVPGYTSTGDAGTYYGVAPPDFAAIYHLNPLLSGRNQFGTPITGANTTIALVERTRMLLGDWNNFRKQFGLSGYGGTISNVHPGGCADPGFNGDEAEAAIDVEWSSAAAPGATILEASCADTAPLNFGVESALQNLVTVGTPATIFSISYGGAEIFNGYGFTQGWTNLVEEGAAEGKSIFVSSGDSGSSADRGIVPDIDGLGVNALADSEYVTSVGGTDFLDTYLGQDSKYWTATNSATGQSALSYIPETPWNNSCASTLIARFNGFANVFDACNSTTHFVVQNGVGGTGGQSLFATKPDWQLLSVQGVPDDNARDQPDVSLFAANGIWKHFYVICMSDPSEGGSPCNYKKQSNLFGNAYGGTSVSAPALAGITALLQQSADEFIPNSTALGNPAPYFYKIAEAQFTTPGGISNCNSSLGTRSTVTCVFHVVTVGNNDQPCVPGTPNCSAPSGDKVGILVQPNVQKGPAFTTQPGYSLATGLGTVDATNLLYNFINIYP
jgi:subtilase family serine protease